MEKDFTLVVVIWIVKDAQLETTVPSWKQDLHGHVRKVFIVSPMVRQNARSANEVLL